jgi:hypothetical protein
MPEPQSFSFFAPRFPFLERLDQLRLARAVRGRDDLRTALVRYANM